MRGKLKKWVEGEAESKNGDGAGYRVLEYGSFQLDRDSRRDAEPLPLL